MTARKQIQVDIPIDAKGLQALFDLTLDNAWKEHDFYRRGKMKYWAVTRIFQSVVLAIGIFGVLLPLTKSKSPFPIDFLGTGTWTFESSAHAGVALLALAAVLMTVDRVMMFTQTWHRYVNAQMAIDTLITAFEFDWVLLTLAWTNGNPTQIQANDAAKRCKQLAADVDAIVDTETKLFGTQLEESTEALKEFVQKQQTQLKKRAELEETRIAAEEMREEEKAKAATSGTARLTLTNADLLGNGWTMEGNIGGQPVTSKGSKVIAITGIPLGPQSIELEISGGAKDGAIIRDVITIAAGESAPLEIDVQAHF